MQVDTNITTICALNTLFQSQLSNKLILNSDNFEPYTDPFISKVHERLIDINSDDMLFPWLNNYTVAKEKIKSLLKTKVTVHQIDKISALVFLPAFIKFGMLERFLLLQDNIDAFIAHPFTKFPSKQKIISIIHKNVKSIRPHLEKIVKKNVSISQAEYLVDIILHLSYLDIKDIESYVRKFEIKYLQYTNILHFHHSIRSRIQEKIGKVLSDDEYIILCEHWFKIANKIIYLLKTNCRAKELIIDYKDKIKKSISLTDELSLNYIQLIRFESGLILNIEDVHDIKERIKENNSTARRVKDKIASLNMKNGKPFDPDQLNKKLLFSMFFYAETIGIKPSPKTKSGKFQSNPILNFVYLLHGFEEIYPYIYDEYDIQEKRTLKINSISKIYSQYQLWKQEPEITEKIDKILHSHTIGCINSIDNANNLFSEILEQLF